MEPYTMLQKVAEIMEYTELLDRAASEPDPYLRSTPTYIRSLRQDIILYRSLPQISRLLRGSAGA